MFSVIWHCLHVCGGWNTQQKHLQKPVRFAATAASGPKKYDRVSDVINDLGWFHADSVYKYHYLVLSVKLASSLTDEVGIHHGLTP